MKQSSFHEYREVKERLGQWLRLLADMPVAGEIATGAADDSLTVQGLLLGLSRQIQTDTFKVAVVGEYSSGKSSLLNVLLRVHNPDGRKTDGLLPTAITPTTAVITTLVYDETRRIEMTLDDGRTLQVNAEQLNGFLTEPTLRRKKFWWTSNEEENERIAKHIRQVRVGCVSPLLGEGVELVDTPGIGSINEDHARITKEFTAETDAALFLISVDPPMGEREMTFLQHIKTITDRCLFVQTKRDLGELTEGGKMVWQRREEEHRRRIEEVLNRRDFPFYCVSAYQAANGLRRNNDQEFADSGFRALEAELRNFLVAERGVPRIEAWIKRGKYALNSMESTLQVRQQQLDAKLADTTLPVAQADDYAQWKMIEKVLKKALDSNAQLAEEKLSKRKPEFTSEVLQEAHHALRMTTPEQLAKNPGHLLRVERAVVKAVQYHRDDLLTPIVDLAIIQTQEPLKEALGELPKAFQQFRNADFEWETSHLGVDLANIVESRTYIKETKRGGFGVVDFFCGPVKTEEIEHILDKEHFNAKVENAIGETYREVKSGMRSKLKEIDSAVEFEMGRIVNDAKRAADQQLRIQKQDSADCQRQSKENQRQINLLGEHTASLNQIVEAQQSLR